ncbi:MAG: hypothetical protein MI756_11655 [Chromatiales bacterium]|nr:hypothetical protein [Chromatiales bacterium]
MFSDFLKRKNIVRYAEQTVDTHFGQVEQQKVSRLSGAKQQKRIDVLNNKLSRDIRSYIQDEKLGVYGKAKLLKAVQTRLEANGLTLDHVTSIVNRLLH